MDNDQLTTLAREYAEEIYPNLSDKIISLRTQEIKNAERLIRFLLRCFCFVEKEKATELCRLTLEHGGSVDYGLIDGLTEIVCDIFPEQYQQIAEGLDKAEIAKEVKG